MEGYYATSLRPTTGPMCNPELCCCYCSKMCMCMCVCIVIGRCLVLILYCTQFVLRSFLCPRVAQQTAGRPTHPIGPKWPVVVYRLDQTPSATYATRCISITQQCRQQLNASESNCCHLSQIKEDTDEPSVCAYLGI